MFEVDLKKTKSSMMNMCLVQSYKDDHEYVLVVRDS